MVKEIHECIFFLSDNKFHRLCVEEDIWHFFLKVIYFWFVICIFGAEVFSALFCTSKIAVCANRNGLY